MSLCSPKDFKPCHYKNPDERVKVERNENKWLANHDLEQPEFIWIEDKSCLVRLGAGRRGGPFVVLMNRDPCQ